MFHFISTIRAILQKPVAAQAPELRQGERPVPPAALIEPIRIQFEGQCRYMVFHSFLFKAALPKADKQYLSAPSLLLERDADKRGMGKIHVECLVKQPICDLPGSRAKLIRVKEVLGVIYNSRDGLSHVFWCDPGKVWGIASPRTFDQLLSCRALIRPVKLQTLFHQLPLDS